MVDDGREEMGAFGFAAGVDLVDASAVNVESVELRDVVEEEAELGGRDAVDSEGAVLEAGGHGFAEGDVFPAEVAEGAEVALRRDGQQVEVARPGLAAPGLADVGVLGEGFVGLPLRVDVDDEVVIFVEVAVRFLPARRDRVDPAVAIFLGSLRDEGLDDVPILLGRLLEEVVLRGLLPVDLPLRRGPDRFHRVRVASPANVVERVFVSAVVRQRRADRRQQPHQALAVGARRLLRQRQQRTRAPDLPDHHRAPAVETQALRLLQRRQRIPEGHLQVQVLLLHARLLQRPLLFFVFRLGPPC
mmetsp:Transcript_37000/g.118608  ORF Transcript_37000/g.118608 Transcript_37000/m.118608 type:complete len:302 (-) Transcript_37000:85-990(-)